jgi:5-formyltetrahydrofolate cyclo-ligase
MRAHVRATLGALAQTRFIEGGAAISRRVQDLDEVRRARVVMAFVPMRRVGEDGGKLMEADITDLLDGVIAAGKRLVLPRGTSSGGLEPCEVGEDRRGELVEAALKGVLEPAATAHRIAAAEIDVVIVPGLAFDAMGGRLGRGKGFYDRFLAEMKDSARAAKAASGADPARRAPIPTLIGVCLEEQVVDRVPREIHDVIMDCVLTDVRTMRVGPSRD